MTPDPAAVPRTELAPGYDIARLIVGGWQWSEGHTSRALDPGRLYATFSRLVQAGFTTFDCADIYTGVEAQLGTFLHRLTRDGDYPTAGIQLHTKFVPDRDDLARVDRAYVRRIVERSLTRLGVDRLDLVQFAWWDYSVPGWLETAGWLCDLQREGKIRLLGATNFDTERMRAFAAAGIPMVTNQVQYSVLDHRPEHGLTDWCRTSGLRLIAYGTLAGGFLSSRYLATAPPPEPLENRSLTKYRLIIDEAGGWERFQDRLGVLSRIAAEHGTTPSVVAVRYVLQRPAVAAVVVGARDRRHLDANLTIGRLQLTAEDIERIDVGCGEGGPDGEVFELERDHTGPHARIMRYNLNRQE